jgi:hypothetical protein
MFPWDLLAGLGFTLQGIILIYGVFRRWKWLVDPDETYWWVSKFEVSLKNFIEIKVTIIFFYIGGGFCLSFTGPLAYEKLFNN